LGFLYTASRLRDGHGVHYGKMGHHARDVSTKTAMENLVLYGFKKKGITSYFMKWVPSLKYFGLSKRGDREGRR